MAVASLRYDHGNKVEETKGGAFIFDGQASSFHEWSFRATLRWTSSKAEDRGRTMNNIIEGLRGEAANVAMDLGMIELLKDDGMNKLVMAMTTQVFPKAAAEAKDLYRSGHKTKGPLSRQTSEPMVNYVSRRRRWWKLLKSLDSTIELSMTILGDLMLEGAGLNKNEQLMVLTSTQNSKDFEEIAKALLEQHPRIHMDENKSHRDKESPKRSFHHSRPKFQRHGHYAEEEPVISEHDDSSDEHHDDDQQQEEDDEELETKDDVEMDVFTCLLCNGADELEQRIWYKQRRRRLSLGTSTPKAKEKAKAKARRENARYSPKALNPDSVWMSGKLH